MDIYIKSESVFNRDGGGEYFAAREIAYARGKAWMFLAQFSAHASRYTYNFESGPLHVPESGS